MGRSERRAVPGGARLSGSARLSGAQGAAPKKRRMRLQWRLFLLQSAVGVLLVALLAGIQFRQSLADTVDDFGDRALTISQTVAAMPEVVKALGGPRQGAIDPLMERMRRRTGADFIVVANASGIRFSHPDKNLIGRSMLTEDNREPPDETTDVLAGRDVTSVSQGHLGRSVRGKAPVRNDRGEVIGLVSTGYLLPRVRTVALEVSEASLPWFGLALLLALASSTLISRRIKNEIMGLEPGEISARLAEELAQTRSYAELLRAQTHEFMNRLHTIGGLIQLGRSDEALGLIQKERRQNDALQSLIADVGVPKVAALVIGKYARAGELGIAFGIEAGSRVSPRWSALADEVLVPAVGNLIENAFEAVAGSEFKSVSLMMGEDPEGLQLEVSDTGPGVDPELASSLFQSGVSSKGERRGLGLSLVRERLASVGGSLAHFRREERTVFQISLPFEAIPGESSK